MATTVCNIKNDKEYDIYGGRGRKKYSNPQACTPGVHDGWLGNPIVVGETCLMCNSIHSSGGSTLKCYEWYLREKLKNNMEFKREFLKLKDKKIACWCHPSNCHVDVIIKYLDGEKEDSFLF